MEEKLERIIEEKESKIGLKREEEEEESLRAEIT